MVKTKVPVYQNKSTRNKARAKVRDIKPKTVPRDVFTIHQLKSARGVEVEPLIEDDFYEEEGETAVEIKRIEDEIDYQPIRPPRMNVTSLEKEEDEIVKIPSIEASEPKDTIKVKFGKFVQLVANHDFAEVIDAHLDDEIIMSSNLLTELAGASDKKEERKIPLVFLIGIAIGVVLTYIFFSK
jgi:hypothetical protein